MGANGREGAGLMLSEVPSLITRWKSHRRKPCIDLNIFVTERFLCFWRVHGVLIASILTDPRPALQCPSFWKILRGKCIMKLRKTSTYQTHWWARPCTQLWNWAYYTISLLTSYKFWRFLRSWCSYPIISGDFFQLHWLTILKIWISLISVASWHRILQNPCIVQMNQIFHVSLFDQETQVLLTHNNFVKQLGAGQF
jgi:hypothetical protein